MFSNPQKFEEKSKRIFITFKNMTGLWFSFVFSLLIINEFLKHCLWYEVNQAWYP